MQRLGLRVPAWLHAALTEKARSENTSLNTLVVENLESALRTEKVEVLKSYWLGELTQYIIAQAEDGRYVFVWTNGVFSEPETDLLPSVNVEDGENGLAWCRTWEGVIEAVTVVADALPEDQARDVRERLGFEDDSGRPLR